MDALDRVRRIGQRAPTMPWSREYFINAANEGKRRWGEIEEVFDVRYAMFQDVVAVIAPDFHLAFSVEHGQFVDMFDSQGMPLGGVVVRLA